MGDLAVKDLARPGDRRELSQIPRTACARNEVDGYPETSENIDHETGNDGVFVDWLCNSTIFCDVAHNRRS
jgi:hypothetical protein